MQHRLCRSVHVVLQIECVPSRGHSAVRVQLLPVRDVRQQQPLQQTTSSRPTVVIQGRTLLTKKDAAFVLLLRVCEIDPSMSSATPLEIK